MIEKMNLKVNKFIDLKKKNKYEGARSMYSEEEIGKNKSVGGNR